LKLPGQGEKEFKPAFIDESSRLARNEKQPIISAPTNPLINPPMKALAKPVVLVKAPATNELNNNKFDVMKHHVQNKPVFISNVLRKDYVSGPPKFDGAPKPQEAAKDE